MRQRIALLGSTGSIGEQTLRVVERFPEEFIITVLTSNNNWERLAEQARRYEPDSVVIANPEHYPALKAALSQEPVKVYAGPEALNQVVQGGEIDTVVNALVGYAGMEPSFNALSAGKRLALANKESLVVAGDLIMAAAAERNLPVLPVDSEHSAVFQCLIGEPNEPEKIILTASGGPFLDTPAEELKFVTPEQALRHPNWEMGAKITIDSATLMNKGFEVIEARWLFGMPADRIEVLVHPQSAVHSMVEFADGSLKAQIGTPDMCLPIQYALTFPYRRDTGSDRFDFSLLGEFTFRKPDTGRFPALELAYECLREGGDRCCVLNAANEIAVEAFLAGRIGFVDIPAILEETLSGIPKNKCASVDDYRQSNSEARLKAAGYVSARARV